MTTRAGALSVPAAFVPGAPAPKLSAAVAASSATGTLPSATRRGIASAANPFISLGAGTLPLSFPVVPQNAESTSTTLLPELGYAPIGFRAPIEPPANGGRRGTALVWFRSDLRLHDHPALTAAAEHAARVVPAYVFDKRQFGKTAFGFEKTGRYRAKFLVEAVSALREQLESRGSRLAVRHGIPEEALLALCRAHGVDTVYLHQEVTYEEVSVEADVEKALKQAGIRIVKMWSNTLYHADDLPFSVEKMPDVYTDFRDSVERAAKIQEPLPVPAEIPGCPKDVDHGVIPTLEQLGLRENDSGRGSAFVASQNGFIGGEREALNRLESYLSEAAACSRGSDASGSSTRYGAQLGADFSCKISPWLALGCVSSRTIMSKLAQSCGGLGGAAGDARKSTTYFELVWRDFFRFITLKYASARLKSPAPAYAPAPALAGSA